MLVRNSIVVNLLKIRSLTNSVEYNHFIIENKANIGSNSEILMVYNGGNLGGSSNGKILFISSILNSY